MDWLTRCHVFSFQQRRRRNLSVWESKAKTCIVVLRIRKKKQKRIASRERKTRTCFSWESRADEFLKQKKPKTSWEQKCETIATSLRFKHRSRIGSPSALSPTEDLDQ
jgi:hypothetical protein